MSKLRSIGRGMRPSKETRIMEVRIQVLTAGYLVIAVTNKDEMQTFGFDTIGPALDKLRDLVSGAAALAG
jgi:hypothetical protein